MEVAHALALTYMRGLGNITTKRLINFAGSAKAVFQLKSTELAEVMSLQKAKHVYNQLQADDCLTKAYKELTFAQRNAIKVQYFLEETYPAKLKQCVDAPLCIFLKGNIALSPAARLISVVGTRAITRSGEDFITALISDLKSYNPIIISGLAVGCDIHAHREAYRNGLQTIGVLAHGLHKIYPSKHFAEAKNIQNNGGLVTEFSSFQEPFRECFLQRNRIIAGMSEATILVESASRGGAMVTARYAFDYNREVFALAGRRNDLYSQGCNDLIKKNIAQLVTSAQDIIEALNWDNTNETKQTTLFELLEPQEKLVYDYLQYEGKQHIDEIASALQLPVYQLASLLLNLELKTCVRQRYGNFYELN